MEDKELIQKILDGDTDLFTCIIDKYKAKVFSIIFSFCGHTSDCEDIAQMVFIKIFKALPKFKFEAEFSTWMYRIVINESITISKKRKHNVVPLDVTNDNDEDEGSLVNILRSNDNTEEELTSKETQKIVQNAMAELKDNYKMALTLRDIEDFSYEEIAQMMNASVENVKVWIFRARNRLKEILLKGGNL